MGWLDTLKGSIVGLDTAPLIYFTEENPAYFHVVDPFFQALFRDDFTVVTSIVTLLEVMVHPIQKGDVVSAKKYRDILFDTQGINTIVLTQDIAEEAARLRASYKIATPDAIQVATAIHGNASIFLTNDIHLPSISELEIVMLDELKTRPEN